jgi:hypothetical protein
MKRGLKALAVLAAVAAAVAGPDAFAVCVEFGGFAIYQCAERTWFNEPPLDAGTVSATFWQIGYGNQGLASGLGSNGTGNSGPTTFNGNDAGLWAVDLVNARSFINDTRVPPRALCLRNNNWGNFGIDGCCDNFRDTSLPGGTGDDGILNPEYNVYYQRNGYPGVGSQDWIVDYPMGVLLRESSGHYYAVAAVASSPRSGPSDVRAGDYNFKDVSNGSLNPISAVSNVVEWRRIPGDRVPGDPSTNLVRQTAFADPNDKLGSARIVDLAWNAAVVHSDQSVRASSNGTITNPGNGVGVNDMGPLVRYVVEVHPIVNPADPYGSLPSGPWPAVRTVFPPDSNTQVTIPPDHCVRLHTYFGKEPQVGPGSQTTANCRLGMCGDLGYDVVSSPACIGGPLVADGKLDDLVARRERGKISLTFTTDHELSVRGFDVYALTKKGAEKIGRIPCNECTSGAGSTYTFKVEAAKVKGARAFEVHVDGTGAKFKVAIR